MIRYDLKLEYEALCAFYGLNAKDELNLMIYKFIQSLKQGDTRILSSGKSYQNGNKANH